MQHALVTGATGFLGGALARRLAANGVTVTATGRNQERGADLAALGMRFAPADLADRDAITALCAGQQVVFHCGALAAPWGDPAAFDRANVDGTRHVLAGCAAHRVQRLVHVSTPSVYFYHDAGRNIAEDHPLPATAANNYVRTKRQAEALVRAGDVPYVMIRPRAIIGPGDTAIVPRILRALQAGRLRVIGDGHTLADFTYVENVVDALLLCAETPSTGRVYNITNGEPVNLWEMVRRLADRLGYTPPGGRVPVGVAFAAAGLLEAAYRWLPLDGEPLLTRYAVGVLSQDRTLDITRARAELGYTPRVSLDEGFERFIDWWQQQHD